MATKKNPDTTDNAVEAEATGKRVEFEWRGTKFTALPSSEWPYEAMEAFEDGKVTHFLKALLGEEEHAKFKALRPLASDVESFITAMQEALGIQGN